MNELFLKAKRAIRFLFYKDISIVDQIRISKILNDEQLEQLFWKLSKADRHHSLEVLEALKFPMIKFYSEEIKVVDESLIMNGKLEFHGEEKEYRPYSNTTLQNLYKFDKILFNQRSFCGKYHNRKISFFYK